MRNTIRKTVFLKAGRERVWAYLTDPDKLATWFHKPREPLTGGQDYAMYGTESGDRLMWGAVTLADPHERLEYSFSITPMAGATSMVKWRLDEVAGGTRLTLEHSGLPDEAAAFDLAMALDKGWDDHFARLRTALHGG